MSLHCKEVESYVFVATTGRSGSNTLGRIFETVRDGISIHEKYPALYNVSGENSLKTSYSFVENNKKKFNQKKLINIKRLAVGKHHYMESNHMFIKNFYRESINAFDKKIKVVHLRRDPLLVATSFLQINSIPGKSKRGQKYLLDPNREDNIIKISDLFLTDKFRNDFYRCLWYCYEIEARINQMKNEYPNIILYKIDTNELNSLDKVVDMLNFFKMEYDMLKLKEIIGKRYNLKKTQKTTSINLNFDETKEMEGLLLAQISDRYGASFTSTLIYQPPD